MSPPELAPSFHVTKLESARRQLRVAISLWFQDADEIAVHTLACAAHQIIHDINQKKGGRDLLFDSLIFKDEYRREAVKWLKRDMNFFKHADNDPDGVTEFSPKLTELFIIMALAGIENFGLKLDPVEAAFSHWYLIRHPQFLTEKGLSQREHLSKVGAIRELEQLSARQFFQIYMQASVQLHHVR
jgi:hypothetical protein